MNVACRISLYCIPLLSSHSVCSQLTLPGDALKKNMIAVDITSAISSNDSHIGLVYKRQLNPLQRFSVEANKTFQWWPTQAAYYVYTDTALFFDRNTKGFGQYSLSAGMEWSNYTQPYSVYIGAQLMVGYNSYEVRRDLTAAFPSEYLTNIRLGTGTELHRKDSTMANSNDIIYTKEHIRNWLTGFSVPIGLRFNLGSRFEVNMEVIPRAYLQFTQEQKTDLQKRYLINKMHSLNFDIRSIQFKVGYKF